MEGDDYTMMNEPLYYFSKMEELREDYRHFYHQLRAYIETLDPDDHWSLQEGWNVELDGTVFLLMFRSMHYTNKYLSVKAIQSGADFLFSSTESFREKN